MNLSEEEKQEASKSIDKKYGKRKYFKFLQHRAHREIFKKDILQPMEREFRDTYKSAYIAKKNTDRLVEKEYARKTGELEEAYKQNSKNVLSLEQVTLREVHREHPSMISEEDIIKWPTTSTQTQ